MVIERSQDIHLGFAAEDQVGFNSDGAVVLKEKAQKTLHKYELQIQERNVYKKSWSKNFPPDVGDASIRSVSGYHNVLLQDKNTVTLKLNFDCRKAWDNWHHSGIILPCSEIKCMYAVEKTNEEYELIINDKARLQSVMGRPTWTDPHLSVCGVSYEYDVPERIAVTSTNRTLDIYSMDSK